MNFYTQTKTAQETQRLNSMLQKFEPSAALAPYIECYYLLRGKNEVCPPRQRVSLLPTGQATLVLNYGDSYVFWDADGVDHEVGSSFLIGPKRKVMFTEAGDNFDRVIIRFTQKGLYPFLKIPAERFTGKVFDFFNVSGQFSRVLESRVYDHRDPVGRIQQLEKILLARLNELKPYSSASAKQRLSLLEEAHNYIKKRNGQVKVTEVCEVTNTYYKQLERLFLKITGFTPKNLAKIIRINHACDLISTIENPEWAKLAREIGYYDQSHFIKDFKAVTLLTPKQFYDRLFSYNSEMRSI